MTISEEPRIRKPGRPRSEQAHQAILDATLELMAEKGFGLMSIEEVAERAGVGKTTIYRRWPSKIDLAVEAMKKLHTEFAIVDTGNLRADLINILRVASQFNASQFAALFFKLINELQQYPELFETFQSSLFSPRMQHMQRMIERAKERGEIRSDVDWMLVTELLGGPFMYRKMLSDLGVPMPDNWPERVVDALFNGLAVRGEESQG